MTPKQRIELKISDTRQALSAMLEKEDRTDGETQAMKDKTLELRSFESELQTAIIDRGRPR